MLIIQTIIFEFLVYKNLVTWFPLGYNTFYTPRLVRVELHLGVLDVRADLPQALGPGVGHQSCRTAPHRTAEQSRAGQSRAEQSSQ